MIHGIAVLSLDSQPLFVRQFHRGDDVVHDPNPKEADDSWIEEVKEIIEFGIHAALRGEPQIAVSDNKYIVFTGYHNMLFLVSGDEEYDEICLLSLLQSLLAAIDLTLPKDWDVQRLLGNFGKLCIIIEEMVYQGTIEHLDPYSIVQLSKLKDRRKK